MHASRWFSLSPASPRLAFVVAGHTHSSTKFACCACPPVVNVKNGEQELLDLEESLRIPFRKGTAMQSINIFEHGLLSSTRPMEYGPPAGIRM